MDTSRSQDSLQKSSQNRIIPSTDLFQEEREITILHREDHYRLSITKLGKLILTK